MVRLWGSKGSSGADPHTELDSDLKDFLERETPDKYRPAAPTPIKSPAVASENTASASQRGPVESSLPTESLFQDGRYAHLWKTYRPLSEIEDATKSDQEKLMDVLEGYKERKRTIGRIALENCALEQFALHDCYANGTIADRMVLCRKQRKAFDRCYTLQAQFLKTLGYLSTYERPASVDEEIQMHADTLYHRMLDQEKAMAEVKSAGDPVADEKPVNPVTATVAKARKQLSRQDEIQDENLPPLSAALQARLKPDAQLELQRKLKDLSPSERELLERQKLSDYDVAMEVQRLRSSLLEEKKQRREEGKATLSDKISGWLGW